MTTFLEELKLVDTPQGITPLQILFALFYVQGMPPGEAVNLAMSSMNGPVKGKVTIQKRASLAREFLKSPLVKNYIHSLIARLESMAVADALEIKMFLTEAIRTPIDQIDGSHKLCQKKKSTIKYNRDGDPISEIEEIEMVSKMDAAKTLIRMNGWDAPIKIDHTHNVGVMIMPIASSVEDWEKAASSQQQLMDDAIDV